MVKFFRRIRQQLLSQKRFSKYILYAGGEILLVMVGILLALQVNNWNGKQQSRKLETQYLKSLRSDLISDTSYYQKRIASSNTLIEGNGQFVVDIFKRQETDQDMAALYRNRKWYNEHLTTQNSTYLELINTGKLNVINNPKVKRSLIEYYRENERTAVHVKEYNEASANITLTWQKLTKLNKYLTDPSIYRFDRSWINDPESEEFQLTLHEAYYYIKKNQDFLNYLENLKKLASELLGQVDQELAQRE